MAQVTGEMEGRPQREVAQRVFAMEYNASDLEYKEEGERSPSFVVTPLGAKVNRLFVVGVLTATEQIGQGGDMWRGQILDPTGTFNVYAGQYQPEAASALAEIQPPAVVAVVGKSRVYSPEEGVAYTSIRPENVKVVDVVQRDRWILETARHTLERLDAIREARKMENPTIQALEELGYNRDVAEGVTRALAHYKDVDLDKYAAGLKDALNTLLGEEARIGGAAGFAPATQAAPSPAPAAPAPAPSAPAQPGAAAPAAPEKEDPRKLEIEEKVNALCGKLDDGKGAPWEEIVAEAAKENVGEEDVEEALNSLMDKGIMYEPVLGRLKQTG